MISFSPHHSMTCITPFYKSSPPSAGGDRGEGEIHLSPPPLPTGRQARPPPSKGEGNNLN